MEPKASSTSDLVGAAPPDQAHRPTEQAHPRPTAWQAKELALAGALSESLVALTSSPSADAIMEQILDSVASVVPYDGATILLFEQNQARIAYIRGFPEASRLPLKAALIPLNNSHFREVLKTKQPYFVVDTQHDPNWVMVSGSEWIRASIGAPIIIQEQVIGLIAIDSSTPGRFDANDMARVELFARYAALAVSNAYQNDVLAQLVYARTAELEQAKTKLGDQEALLRSAQHIAHVGSWVSDPATQQLTWSEELFRISGFDPAQGEPNLEAVFAILQPDQREQLISLLQRIEQIHEPIEAEISFIRPSDGTVRHAFVRAEPVGVPRVAQMVQGIVLDITERKQAEEALRQALASEKEISALKSRFVAMASHEFRNPLNLILANAEMLLETWPRLSPEACGHRLQVIQTQAIGLNEIIRRLLELSQLQAGTIVFRPERLDLANICREVMLQVQAAAPGGPRIRLNSVAPQIWVNGDVLYVYRIVSNLVTNAHKYTLSDAPVEITIALVGGCALLCVEDRGIGIEPTDLAHIFDPFHRGVNVKEIPGSGLGMAIVKQLVELHNGQITVEREIGSGTRVVLQLPLASA
ncbi:MAG: GAF domain-containing protein [Caldilineaceae bacterium]|nr:GAF domain-containing protein [Caldilineaceae bacterium]